VKSVDPTLDFHPRNTLVAIKSIDDLQPGVLRYYREIKLVR